ncbi:MULTISPECIES: TetR/AcrR family transcriptional regulator [unclassified Streptomyces]|uniref:TetR/AcrR family transcriptional regulator n=1 Tax=unclassified Streptomyces TaxID=2593676 RepID=UPI0036A470FF
MTDAGRSEAKPTTRGRYAPTQLDEQEILRRGLETFAELGYAATTVRELARRLEVSHNFINERYGSKGGFWRAVVDFALLGAQAQFDHQLAEPRDDGERLRGVIVQLYRISANASAMNRLLTDESTRDSDRLDYLHERFIKPFWESIEPVIGRLAAMGRLPRVPSYVLYTAITGPALALAHDPIADRLDPALAPVAEQDRNNLADALSGLVLDGLLRPPVQ